MHYGPYITISPGKYRVTFKVYAKPNIAGSFKIDIATSPSQKIIPEQMIYTDAEPIELEFTSSTTETIEFRVFSTGNEDVTFKSVSIKSISKH